MQLFCKEMIKIPFNRHYALSMKNEKKLPEFFRLYDNNDYENCLFSAQPHLFKYPLNPPSLESISLAYFQKDKNEKKIENKKPGVQSFPDSQIFFINSIQKSQMQSETKDHSDNFMFFCFHCCI